MWGQVVKTDSCNRYHNTKPISVSNDGVHSSATSKWNIPFYHQVTGAAKLIGVTFSSTLPRGFGHPCRILDSNAPVSAYFKAVSKITDSGRPNYKGCQIDIH